MVNEIYKLKNKVLDQVNNEINERGLERIDVNRMGEMVDMVKDLAQAEKDCWKAQYYRHVVTDAMESKYGYSDANMRPDYAMSSSRSTHSSDMMGHDDLIDKLGEEYKTLMPEQKMAMKSKILTKLSM